MSNDLIFTAKQQELMSLLKHNKLHRLNLLEGSVRSGKTWISLILWAFWIADRPTDYAYLMSAKTLQTLKRNCLMLLQELVGEDNFKYSLSTKEGRLFGRKILLEGANDAKSENKIRGMTLGGAYCDELTLFPKDFFSMLLSRLSVKGAKLIATTNPDVPTHWLKKEYIDNPKVDMLVLRFLIDDNTTLPEEYVREIKKEYTGVYFERFIRGNWVAAEGVIYPLFADNPSRYIVDTLPYFDINDEAFQALRCEEAEKLNIIDNTQNLRVTEHTDALKRLLDILGMQLGFSPGTLSFDSSSGVKTATEVAADEKDTLRTVQNNKNIITEVIENLADVIINLTQAANGSSKEYTVSVNWQDNIIGDDNTRIENNINLVQSGLKSKLRAIMDAQNIDEKAANEELQRIAKENDIDGGILDGDSYE